MKFCSGGLGPGSSSVCRDGRHLNTLRVVVVSREDSFAGGDPVGKMLRGLKCVCVRTPYEGAAELLAEGAAALVIELAQMTPTHLRLLQIARAAHAPVLGFGPLGPGTSSEDVNGVRLVDRDELAEQLQQVLAAGKQDQPPAATPAEPEPTIPPAAHVDETPVPLHPEDRAMMAAARKFLAERGVSVDDLLDDDA